MIRVYSRGIMAIPCLPALLGQPLVMAAPVWQRQQPGATAIAGWGLRPTTQQARAQAAAEGLPYLALEDGFLRSVGLGQDDPPLSVVIDDLGIYYDASRPSRLEALISAPPDAAAEARAEALVMAWREAGVSKYNHLREHAGALPARYVLVADQTLGDASVRHGEADAASFQRMLDAALAEHPDCCVLVKIHPDVFSGRKRGYFDVAKLQTMARVQVLAADVHPVRLLREAEAVYAVTSQIGFEALLHGRPLRVFGMPFYAGWGLSVDDLPAPARRGRASLTALVHAALIAYPRYLDPETGRRCEVETVLAHLRLQRDQRLRFPEVIEAVGFSRWKRPIVRRFLAGSRVHFRRSAAALPEGSTLAVWGRKPLRGQPPAGTQSLHLEDGFLRSVGLGADLVQPLSWVIDRQGIYYDARSASDLETLLATTDFSPALLARAAALRARIVAGGLTKYNTGSGGWQPARRDRRVILVPGQVASDASIAFGTASVRSNLALLQAVRACCPDAHVVYKPHPDVLAGLRPSGPGDAEIAAFCDEVITGVGMQEALAQVDEVHVMTSLAGFEALLRGKPVTCHGQPFYAGWGLTRDIGMPEAVSRRRGRVLALDALVAATLILYPTYVSRRSGCFAGPECVLDELLAWRAEAPAQLPLRQRLLRRVRALYQRLRLA